MKKRYFLFTLFIFFVSISFAQQPTIPTPTLRVAVDQFAPPFCMRAANQQLFGYDVDMLKIICKEINRNCQFQPMPFKDIIPSLLSDKADIGIGAIAITPERAKEVLFSKPYLPSFSQFLAQRKHAEQPFSLTNLANKLIGVEEGTVFKSLVTLLGIKNPNVIIFRSEDEMIDALGEEELDYILLDAATARFWSIKASSHVRTVGEPLPYAYGLGIAVNPKEINLLPAINDAITKFQNSPDFKQHYMTYFGSGQ